MTTKRNSSRRSFLKKGALLAVPLAAAAPAAMIADDGLKARLARLEDEAAIRQLHQAWLRAFNTGTAGVVAPRLADSGGADLGQSVRSIAADHAGQPDAIELAADCGSAFGRFNCSVGIETPIAQDCTLARMAHAQGSGFVRRTERRVLKIEYVKSAGAWTIAKAELVSV